MKKTGKRWLAALLAVIMVIGVLPMSALAAGSDQSPVTDTVTSDETSGANLVKTATYDPATGKYSITLESWVTGEVTTTTHSTPLDIVLVLDQSGSMSKNFTSSATDSYTRITDQKNKTYYEYANGFWDHGYSYSNGLWYKLDDGSYVQVTVKRELKGTTYQYTYTWAGQTAPVVSSKKNTNPGYTFYYKTTNVANVTKLEALKAAANSFISAVAADAQKSSVNHRVAVVGFASTNSGRNYYANTELLSTTSIVNYGSANNANYQDALVSANAGSGTVNSRLTTAVDRLSAEGDTYSEYGIDMANKIFEQYPLAAGETRQRVIIMFTDGYTAPYDTNDFKYSMANNAIANAKTAKETYQAKVYTVGIFDDADPVLDITKGFKADDGWNWNRNNLTAQQETVAANRYMHYVSSNYAGVSKLQDSADRVSGSNFYLAASNASALNNVFSTISSSVLTPSVAADDTTVVSDTLSQYFDFANLDDDGKLTGYTVKTAAYTGKDAQGNDTWGAAEDVSGVTVTVEGKTVKVSGFDYAENAVAIDNDDPTGRKLIVTFEITPDPDFTGWAEGTNPYPTNTGAAISNDDETFAAVTESPELPVTAYKVSYKYEGSQPVNPPELPEAEIILAGTSVTVAATPGNVEENGYTYTFDGWYLGSTKTEGTITPTDSIELTGTWTRTAKEYTITYDLDGGTVTPENPTTYTVETKTFTLNNPTRAGYTFLGWTGTDLTGNTETVTIAKGSTGDRAYTAHWEASSGIGYTVEYYLQNIENDDYTKDATRTRTPTGTTGETVAETPETITGFTFNAEKSTVSGVVAADGSLVLKLYYTRNSYNVTYAYTGDVHPENEPAAPATASYKYGAAVTAADKPTADGYTFHGWNKDGSEVTTFNMPAEDVALTGSWTKDDVITEVNVIFVVENGKWGDDTTEIREVITLTNGSGKLGDVIPTATPDSGYGNGRWVGTEPTADTEITEDTTFTYHYDLLPTGAMALADAVQKELIVRGYGFEKETFTVEVSEVKYQLTGAESPSESEGDSPLFTGSVTMTKTGYASFTDWTAMVNTADGAPYTFDEATQSLIFKQPGSYLFKVEEIEGSNANMEYGTEVHYLGVRVTDSGSGELEIVHAQVDGLDEINQLRTSFSLSVYNYYEGDPDTFPVKLGDFVKKTYTSTYSYSNTADFTFTATIRRNEYGPQSLLTAAAPEPAADLSKPFTGMVRITTGETEKAVDFGTIYLEAGIYEVEVSEINGKLADVEYDSTVYRFTLEVQNNGSVYFFSLVAVDGNGNFTELERGTKAVFRNKFNYNSTVIIPPVPTTPDLNTEDHVAYLIGFTDGTIRPEANITRGEVATIFFRLLTDESRTKNWSQTNAYTDVPADLWCNNAISTLSNMGIINGYTDGTFRPSAPITRSELTKIAVSFFQYADSQGYAYDGRFPDVKGTEWYARYLAAAVEFGLVEGDGSGNFRPNDPITRAETCTIVNRTLGRKPDAAHLLPSNVMNIWPDNSNVNAWYYAAMQEATNSHDYNWVHETQGQDRFESWTAKLAERDWAALERMWSNANSAPGGEVID